MADPVSESAIPTSTGQYRNNGGSAGGPTTTGGSTSGGSTSGGGSTTGGGPVGCAGVYCSPSYACDPADGICKCGGQICTSGNCDADSGVCLPGCPPDGGLGAIAFVTPTPGEAFVLPFAFQGIAYQRPITVGCAEPPVTFTVLVPLPPGLAVYDSASELVGVPTVFSSGVPFEFELEAESHDGGVAFQNFLLAVDVPGP